MNEPYLALQYPSPASNPDLIGHAWAEHRLLDAFHSQRLHHAWLLTGPRGIGKATLAYRLAKYIFVNDIGQSELFGDGFEAVGNQFGLGVLGEHPVVHRVAARAHADLLAIEKSKNDRGELRSEIIINDIRKAKNFLQMTAAEEGWRIIIVDSADDMNVNAASALLKLLEEPPARALILLISHNPGQLLPTIRSRCQKIRLKALTPSIVMNLISTFSADQSTTDLEVVSILSEGSIGKAVQLIEMNGISKFRDIKMLLTKLPDLDMGALQVFASESASKKHVDTFNLTGELIRWVLSRIITNVAKNRGKDSMLKELASLETIVDVANLDHWLDVWRKVDDLFRSAERVNLDRKQIILNTFLLISQASGAK